MKNYYFAVDLGATSGRTILGSIENGKVLLEDVNRFPNHLIHVGNHYYWDIYELYRNILEGLKIVANRGIQPLSIGIDTWGVDFVMLGKDGGILRQPYSYRDPHTEGASQRLFSRVPSDEIYEKTGIQVMDFNSLFQLDTLRRNNDSALEAADKLLFIPDALSFMLTGERVTEYTIATTAQIVNARTRQIDATLLELVDLTIDRFGRLVYPGERIGNLSSQVCQATGMAPTPVIAVAGHDTASAVAAIPASTPNFAYLSSGTWSLMGVETSEPVINSKTKALNFTNEGGVEGTIRLLKNICGMWLLERCRTDWPQADYATLTSEASEAEPFRSLIDPDHKCFANPTNMCQAIINYCNATGQPAPQSRGQFVRCIFESLALRYRQVLENLKALCDHPIEVLHVIGGGSRNAMLNQWTADAIAMDVIAGPAEATALGNVMIQAISSGEGKNIASMRSMAKDSLELVTYHPQNTKVWDEAYQKFVKIQSLSASKNVDDINH